MNDFFEKLNLFFIFIADSLEFEDVFKYFCVIHIFGIILTFLSIKRFKKTKINGEQHLFSARPEVVEYLQVHFYPFLDDYIRFVERNEDSSIICTIRENSNYDTGDNDKLSLNLSIYDVSFQFESWKVPANSDFRKKKNFEYYGEQMIRWDLFGDFDAPCNNLELLDLNYWEQKDSCDYSYRNSNFFTKFNNSAMRLDKIGAVLEELCAKYYPNIIIKVHTDRQCLTVTAYSTTSCILELNPS